MEKRGKKGQVAVFVIVGILIFVAIAILFFIKTGDKKTQDLEIDSIKSYIDSCVESVSREGVYLIAMQGGYFEVPNPKEEYSYIEIPIYWDTKKDYFPDKEVVEEEIMKYIQLALPICLDEFKDFEDSGFSFEIGNLDGSATFKKDVMKIKLNYPISVKKGDATVILEDFSTDVYSDLNKGYEISRLIIEEHKKKGNNFLLGYITNLAYENGIKFETMNFNDNEVLITLILDEEEIHFIYSFIIKYGDGE